MYSFVSTSTEIPVHSMKRPMFRSGCSSTLNRSSATGSGCCDPFVTALTDTCVPSSDQVHGATGLLALDEQLAPERVDDVLGDGGHVDRGRGGWRRGRGLR